MGRRELALLVAEARGAIGIPLAPVRALHAVILQAAPLGRGLADVGGHETDVVALGVVRANLERVETTRLLGEDLHVDGPVAAVRQRADDHAVIAAVVPLPRDDASGAVIRVVRAEAAPRDALRVVEESDRGSSGSAR